MSDYDRLIQEFCSLAGLPDAKAIGTGSPIEVDGVTCSVTPNRQRPAEALVVYVEFGGVPSGREAEIHAELLSQNYLGSPDSGVIFGYSALTQRVICMQQLTTAELTGQRLIDVLHHIASKAEEWRRTYFLKPKEDVRPALSGSLSGGARALLGSRELGSRGA
ncbi:Tir chaperone protein (CesT) family protein [Roseateles sp. YR242]|uniref:CesT family type III secretion system chaperone n=1 Tax=Roseateles sp. YR242 TaxID=1855305 RepID=UPI0008D1953E|nr:CesT family type III secretion system chaperone [Roseateles sp. YR242]SEK64675.1 Tir chaperone protein (CesT) family protein [Roseateles sp. YR242]